MPKRKTLEDVKKFLEEYDINHDCELLSTEYINNRTPLLLKCNCCGEVFKRDFGHIQRKRFLCNECA